MLPSNCDVCSSKKSGFSKEREVSGLLSSLGIRSSLSQIPLVWPLFFRGVKWTKE